MVKASSNYCLPTFLNFFLVIFGRLLWSGVLGLSSSRAALFVVGVDGSVSGSDVDERGYELALVVIEGFAVYNFSIELVNAGLGVSFIAGERDLI